MAWPPPPPRDAIALVLAIGLVTALNVICVAILYDALRDPAEAGISENATQILTGWGGGIIGILGAVFGYKAGQQAGATDEPADRGQGTLAHPAGDAEPNV